MVAGAREDVLMAQSDTVFGVRMKRNLLLKPVPQVVREIRRSHTFFARSRCTPPVLHRINEEQHIAIDEAIRDTLELRFGLCAVREAPVGIEMVVVVKTRTVVVVTVCRNHRHLIQHRPH